MRVCVREVNAEVISPNSYRRKGTNNMKGLTKQLKKCVKMHRNGEEMAQGIQKSCKIGVRVTVQMTRLCSPVNKDRSRHTQYISPSVHSRPPHSSCSGTWQTYLQRNGKSCAFIGVVKVACAHHNLVLKCRVCQWASLTRHFAWTLPRTYIFRQLFTRILCPCYWYFIVYFLHKNEKVDCMRLNCVYPCCIMHPVIIKMVGQGFHGGRCEFSPSNTIKTANIKELNILTLDTSWPYITFSDA